MLALGELGLRPVLTCEELKAPSPAVSFSACFNPLTSELEPVTAAEGADKLRLLVDAPSKGCASVSDPRGDLAARPDMKDEKMPGLGLLIPPDGLQNVACMI